MAPGQPDRPPDGPGVPGIPGVPGVPGVPVGAAAETWRSDWPAGQTLSAEEYRAVMDEAGVARAVLTTTVRRDGFDNSYPAAAAAADPARFAFAGNFDVLAPGAARAIEEQAERGPMRGARFYGGTAVDAADWLGDDRAAAAWAVADRLGLVVSAQRTQAARLSPLRSMAARFPGVPVVVHSAADPALGGPALGGPGQVNAAQGEAAQVNAAQVDAAQVNAVCALAACPNVLMMLTSKQWSATAGPGDDWFLRRLADAFGPDRLMWGSYSLFAGARLPGAGQPGAGPSLAGLLAGLSERLGFLSPPERSMVLGGTAARTFWPGHAVPGHAVPGHAVPGHAGPGRPARACPQAIERSQ